MRAATALGVAAALALLPASAAEYTVSPMRADLTAASRSVAFTIDNVGRETLSMQVSVRRWTQDASGADRFEDSGDLVFYPKRFDALAGVKRVVRLGTEAPAGAAERAYRVYFEELPSPTPVGEAPGSGVAMLVSFAMPVFVAPAAAAPRAEIDAFEVTGGRADIRIRNAGNQTFIVSALAFEAQGVAVENFAPWYLLPGSSRTYSGVVGAAACAAGKLAVVASFEGAPAVRREISLAPAQCGR